MNFNEQVKQQRQILQDKKSGFTKQKAELDSEIAVIDRELKALDAYEKALTPPQKKRSGVRATVLKAIQNYPNTTRSQLLGTLNAQSNARPVDNSLSALVKSGKIRKENEGYIAVLP